MYQPMAQTKCQVEQANLKGLIHAFTLKTCVPVIRLRSRQTAAKPTEAIPNQKSGLFRTRSPLRKSIMLGNGRVCTC